MTDQESDSDPSVDRTVLIFIASVLLGGVAFAVVSVSIAEYTGSRASGEPAGFLALCAATFPFARRTWAADMPVWRYRALSAAATVGGTIRLMLS